MKLIKLIFINLIVGVAIAQIGVVISQNFLNNTLGPTASIYLLTSFLISAFCIGNAYRYSQLYEKEKETKKKAFFWFIGTFLTIFFIQMLGLLSKQQLS